MAFNFTRKTAIHYNSQILTGIILLGLATPKLGRALPEMLDRGEGVRYSDKVRAAPKRPLLKEGRVEFTPRVGISINDPYYYHSKIGMAIAVFPSEYWGLSLGGNYFFSRGETQNLELVRKGLAASIATNELPNALGYLELQWVPIYGKLSVFNHSIVHFESYLSAGAGMHTEQRKKNRPLVTASFGQRLTVANWCTFSVELRDVMYPSEVRVYHDTRLTLAHYLLISAGLSFYVPVSSEYTRQ